jgi:hypothetical protein
MQKLLSFDSKNFDYSQMACLPKREDLIAAGKLQCPPEQGEFLCNMKAADLAMSEALDPPLAKGPQTPTSNTQRRNNQRRCYEEQGFRQHALGTVGIMITQAYTKHLNQYIKMAGENIAVPCYDPQKSGLSMEQLLDKFLKKGTLVEIPDCLRQDLRLLALLKRDNLLLDVLNSQLAATKTNKIIMEHKILNQNPINPK